MVISEADLIGSTARPAEHNPPLIVDPDAVKSAQVATKCMKTIARRQSQVIDVVGGIDDIELVPNYSQRSTLSVVHCFQPFSIVQTGRHPNLE